MRERRGGRVERGSTYSSGKLQEVASRDRSELRELQLAFPNLDEIAPAKQSTVTSKPDSGEPPQKKPRKSSTHPTQSGSSLTFSHSCLKVNPDYSTTPEQGPAHHFSTGYLVGDSRVSFTEPSEEDVENDDMTYDNSGEAQDCLESSTSASKKKGKKRKRKQIPEEYNIYIPKICLDEKYMSRTDLLNLLRRSTFKNFKVNWLNHPFEKSEVIPPKPKNKSPSQRNRDSNKTSYNDKKKIGSEAHTLPVGQKQVIPFKEAQAQSTALVNGLANNQIPSTLNQPPNSKPTLRKNGELTTTNGKKIPIALSKPFRLTLNDNTTLFHFMPKCIMVPHAFLDLKFPPEPNSPPTPTSIPCPTDPTHPTTFLPNR
ncbi:hypothetical protein HDV00_005688 [Rhizophlyctis rosea]|nr:hypothetical protein HDV00_005688 [Rhizophlyctis rosea]